MLYQSVKVWLHFYGLKARPSKDFRIKIESQNDVAIL